MRGLLPLMATLAIFVAPAAAKGDDKQDCAAHKDQGHRIIACTRVIHLTPGDAVAYHNRGDARQRNGDLDTAIVDFTNSIEINPALARAYESRGRAYASKGNYTRAIADVTKAGELAAKVMPTRGATLPTKSATTAPKAVTPPPQSLDKASSNKAWPEWATAAPWVAD